MKKLLILLLLTPSVNAGYLDDWTDEQLCGWTQRPSPPAHIITEINARGLSCGNEERAADVLGATITPKTQTKGLGYPDGELREPDYSLFYAKANYFKKLVDNGMYFSAQNLFNKYKHNYFLKKSLFSENRPYDDLIKEFRAAFNGIRATFEPKVQDNINDINAAITDINNVELSLEGNWSDYKKLLNKSRELSLHYSSQKNPIIGWLITDQKPASLKLKLRGAELELRNSLKKRATKAFRLYDIVNKPSFFDAYPVSLYSKERVELLTSVSSYIISTLDRISAEEASIVIKKYELDKLKTPIKIRLLANQFKSYDILNKISFFSGYSLTPSDEIKVVNSLSEHLLTQLKKHSLEQAIKIINLYKLNRSVIEIHSKLPQIILNKSLSDKEPSTKDILEIIKNMEAIGIKEKSLLPDDYQISVFKITSKHIKEPIVTTSKLLKKPSSIIQDFSQSPFIVTVQSRVTSVETSDDNLEKIESQYKSSTSIVQNPKYSRLQSLYQRASDEYDYATRELNDLKQWVIRIENEAKEYASRRDDFGGNDITLDCYSYGINTTCTGGSNSYSGFSEYARQLRYESYIGNKFWGLEAKVKKIKNKINRARNNKSSYSAQLANTPTQISKDKYKNYSFTTRAFQVTKNVERLVFLINNVSKTYSGFDFKHPETKTFVYASGLDKDDKNYPQNKFQTDADVEIFVNKADEFSLDKLISLIPLNHSGKKFEIPIEEALQEVVFNFEQLTKQSLYENNESSSESISDETEKSIDYIEKIKEAKSLLDAGIISEEEFEDIKEKIIDNI